MPVYIVQVPSIRISKTLSTSPADYKDVTNIRHHEAQERARKGRTISNFLLLLVAGYLLNAALNYFNKENKDAANSKRFSLFTMSLSPLAAVLAVVAVAYMRRGCQAQNYIVAYHVDTLLPNEIIGTITERLPITLAQYKQYYINRGTNNALFVADNLRGPHASGVLDRHSIQIAHLKKLQQEANSFEFNEAWKPNSHSVLMYIASSTPPDRAFREGITSSSVGYSSVSAANDNPRSVIEQLESRATVGLRASNP